MTHRSPEKLREYLIAYKKTGNLKKSAAALFMSESLIHDWRKQSARAKAEENYASDFYVPIGQKHLWFHEVMERIKMYWALEGKEPPKGPLDRPVQNQDAPGLGVARQVMTRNPLQPPERQAIDTSEPLPDVKTERPPQPPRSQLELMLERAMQLPPSSFRTDMLARIRKQMEVAKRPDRPNPRVPVGVASDEPPEGRGAPPPRGGGQMPAPRPGPYVSPEARSERNGPGVVNQAGGARVVSSPPERRRLLDRPIGDDGYPVRDANDDASRRPQYRGRAGQKMV